ncbi:MAG: RluA family pseudouridine synthase [Verrucomicrobiae bacterium]|nr:RluA family pseudouridine synthase [Verrucomicrobiae bacterium]
MAKTSYIELGRADRVIRVPILYEDRSVIAIDKPVGWLVVPAHWRHTARNLQAEIEAAIAAGAFWAKCRNLKFLRYVHRLDADTSGVLLCVKSQGAIEPFSRLFELRKVRKLYLAVVRGVPREQVWVCTLKLLDGIATTGRVMVDPRHGLEAETRFRLIKSREDAACGQISLLEAEPVTGRTHQIRVHLAASGLPVLGDNLYGGRRPSPGSHQFPLGLRAIELSYTDPFMKRPVRIAAPAEAFLNEFGFESSDYLTARMR